MILSCVKRMNERFGVSMTAKVLKGSRDKKIVQFDLTRLTTYGLLSRYTEKEITEMIHFLIAENLLAIEEGRYPTIRLNQNSVDVLKGERPVEMYTAPIPTTGDSDFHVGLFTELRALRKEIADEKNLPPYILFSDATLKELSRYFPQTKEEMLQIKGIGEVKFEQYGESFLTLLQDWRARNPDVEVKVLISADTPVVRKKDTDDEGPSHLVSYNLFQSGKTIKEIAAIRGFKDQT